MNVFQAADLSANSDKKKVRILKDYRNDNPASVGPSVDLSAFQYFTATKSAIFYRVILNGVRLLFIIS